MPGRVGFAVAGRYLLSDPFGRGGTGQLWRARDEALDREVAVKEILIPTGSSAERAGLLARVTHAARAASRLDHPGVITILDVVEDEDVPWIVMRLVDGPSLGARLAERGGLPWPDAARIGAQVADALRSAHEAGIPHGDLHPGNILLAGPCADRAVLTDFGIARVLDATAPLAGQALGAGPVRFGPVRSGAVHYLAPEQLEDGAVGPPADLWALGVILYHATEGRPPFAGSTVTSTMAAILIGHPDPPERAGSLRGPIESLLAKDPAARPDAQSVAAALAAATSSPPDPSPPASSPAATSASSGSAPGPQAGGSRSAYGTQAGETRFARDTQPGEVGSGGGPQAGEVGSARGPQPGEVGFGGGPQAGEARFARGTQAGETQPGRGTQAGETQRGETQPGLDSQTRHAPGAVNSGMSGAGAPRHSGYFNILTGASSGSRTSSPSRRQRQPPLVAALSAAIRSNPRLAVGAITAIAMVLALLLVTTLFSGSAHRPGAPGRPPASPGHSAPP